MDVTVTAKSSWNTMSAVTAELMRDVTDWTATDIMVETTTSFVFVRLFCLAVTKLQLYIHCEA